MFIFISKIAIAAIAIAFSSWLAGKKPELAGFIIALPLASFLALAFSYFEHNDPTSSITFAKSIMIGMPVSLLFFVPFFFAEKLEISFWVAYLTGFTFLVVGFFIHKYIVGFF